MSLMFPEIDPVAIQLGPLAIRWYALAYLAGFLGGWFYASKITKLEDKLRPNKDDIDDFLTWMVLGVILGGRLGYILFYNLPYYAEFPMEVFKLWEGGMAFHGGLIGAILSLVLFSLYKKIPLMQMTDVIAVVTPIGLFFGRIANFVNAELFGRITGQPWGMVFPTAPDDYPRHPSQLYEAALEGVALFIILNILYYNKNIRSQHGFVSAAFLMGYATFRFIVEFFREPDQHLGLLGSGMSMGQILCIPMFLFGVIVLAYARRQKNH